MWPLAVANFKAVWPVAPLALTSASASNNACTMSVWPQKSTNDIRLLPLRRLSRPVEEFAAFVMERERGLGHSTLAARSDADPQETTGLLALGVFVRDPGIRIRRAGLAGGDRAPRIGVADGPARELFEATGMHRVVLPVPVAAYQIKILVQEAVPGGLDWRQPGV